MSIAGSPRLCVAGFLLLLVCLGCGRLAFQVGGEFVDVLFHFNFPIIVGSFDLVDDLILQAL